MFKSNNFRYILLYVCEVRKIFNRSESGSGFSGLKNFGSEFSGLKNFQDSGANGLPREGVSRGGAKITEVLFK